MNKIQNKIHSYIKDIDKNGCNTLSHEDMFDHIKNCFDCRNKLVKYINNDMTNNNNQNDMNNNQNDMNNNQNDINNNQNKTNTDKYNSMFNYFGKIQTKEIIIILILGIFLIIIIDLLIRKRNK